MLRISWRINKVITDNSAVLCQSVKLIIVFLNKISNALLFDALLFCILAIS